MISVMATDRNDTEVVTRKDRLKSLEFQASTKFCHCGTKRQIGGEARAPRWVLSAVRLIRRIGAKDRERAASARAGR